MLEAQHKCVDQSSQKAVSVKLDDKSHFCLIRIKIDHMVISVFRFGHCVVSTQEQQKKEDTSMTDLLFKRRYLIANLIAELIKVRTDFSNRDFGSQKFLKIILTFDFIYFLFL